MEKFTKNKIMVNIKTLNFEPGRNYTNGHYLDTRDWYTAQALTENGNMCEIHWCGNKPNEPVDLNMFSVSDTQGDVYGPEEIDVVNLTNCAVKIGN